MSRGSPRALEQRQGGDAAPAGAEVAGDRAGGGDDRAHQVVPGAGGEQPLGRADDADRARHEVVTAEDGGGDARVADGGLLVLDRVARPPGPGRAPG